MIPIVDKGESLSFYCQSAKEGGWHCLTVCDTCKPQSSLKEEGVCKEATMFYKDNVSVKFQNPTEDQVKYLLYADSVIREKESSLTPKSIRDSGGWKEECERLAGLVKFGQEKYYELNPPNENPKIDFISVRSLGEFEVHTEPAPPNEKSASLKPNKLSK